MSDSDRRRGRLQQKLVQFREFRRGDVLSGGDSGIVFGVAETAQQQSLPAGIEGVQGHLHPQRQDVTAAIQVIDEAACRAHLGVRFSDGGSRIEPRNPGVRGALGRILGEVSAGMADGTWDRIKACRADDCRYAFLDTAKNRSRAWCSMQSCGNRAKVHAYRERHQA